MTTAKAVLGVLAGMAAGAALGVLFAPGKGADTRKKITRKSADIADTFENLAESVEERMEKKFDELLNAVNGKIRKIRSQADTELNKNTLSN